MVLYDMKEPTNWNFGCSTPRKCFICSKEFVEMLNPSCGGIAPNIFVCKDCFKNHGDKVALMVFGNIATLQNQQMLLRSMLYQSTVTADVRNCDQESNEKIIAKLRKLHLPFEHEIKTSEEDFSDEDMVSISFKVRSPDDFETKWKKICEAQTECGCSLMYGDGCHASVQVKDAIGDTKSLDLEVLHADLTKDVIRT